MHRAFPAFVLAASALVMAAALTAQYWGGLAPCELCLYERWPWDAAIVVGLVATMAGSRPALPWVALLLALDFALGSALAFYHVGVEERWFAGPTACTAAASAADSVAALRAQLLAQQPVRCDEVQWSLFGISLAGFNLIASIVMAGASLAVFLYRRRPLFAASAARRGTA